MRPGPTLAFLLTGILAATPLGAQERQIEPLELARLDDSPETRAQYPYLAEALDDAAAFNSEFPTAVPSEIWIATLMGEGSGFGRDILIAQFQGTMSCGALGCVTRIVGIDTDGAPRPLLDTYIHPSAPPELSHCGDTPSLLAVIGHGMELAWTEWRLEDDALVERRFDPQEAPIDSAPPCPP